MPLNVARVRQCLQHFDFRSLFVQELGWDRHPASLTVVVDGTTYALEGVAEKRGFQVFVCPTPNGSTFPDHPTRSKIERQVAKSAHEHIIIYTDAAKTVQKWQWVRRELGRPLARREYDFFRGHTGEMLAQKLQYLAFELDEEERLTLVDVTRRARQAFDVDRVTKRFYDRFKTEHATFLKFVKGITATADAQWYASVMLNRLMFVYFIQKKGFLDGDPDYLRNRMKSVRQQKGKDKFHSFYRYFLLRLFHEGLGQPPAQRKKDLEALLGDVPYLNGGLFDVHELERSYPDIQIADDAFERLFDFFDAYQWHLDERPLRADNEINPDVLGYIFEKYINQKQMGAYYTKEDITGYIARNTIIPFLFNAAEKKCAIAFKPDSAVWRLLRDDPDRYIYSAVKHGVIRGDGSILPESELPAFVQKGMHDPKARMFEKRYNLEQAPADDPIRLVTETWREYVCRRQRCLEIREKLRRGEVHDINDLITLNLDICQFAEDVIDNCEGPELLRAFWHAIKSVSVLDPACGSGAFLFAALNILEPLYEACLERMRAFLEDLQRSGDKHHPEKFSDFRKILEDVARHPNHRYFILKSIIIGNLYGVDIMEEAVEICKLRLFLKLVAQVENAKRVEPLPDIDFNIRPGNTLVGFASLDEVKKTIKAGHFAFEEKEVQRIVEEAEVVDRAFAKFRQMQTEYGMDAKEFSSAKTELRRRLDKLRDELDRFLAGEYGVDTEKPKLYEQWRKGHQPFHWLAEFYGIMAGGGFDVIIGNPPWIEYAKVKNDYTIKNYQTEPCGNLHAVCTERGLRIRSSLGCMSFIVQLPMVSSSRMVTVRRVLKASSSDLHVIPLSDTPSKLFDGIPHCRSVIWTSCNRREPCHENHMFTTRYQRWSKPLRQSLFRLLEFTPIRPPTPFFDDQFPKYANKVGIRVFQKVKEHGDHTISEFLSQRETRAFVFYQEATEYWVKATVGLPYYAKNGKVGAPAHGRNLYLANEDAARWTCALMHSSLFFVYFVAHSDCFHLSDGLVRGFPVPKSLIGDKKLMELGGGLMDALRGSAERKIIQTKAGGKIAYDEYYGWKAKATIDEIDALLAKHYGFTDEELDFIINYDIKYRLGQDGGDEEDAEDGD
jgi:hypothetical protein